MIIKPEKITEEVLSLCQTTDLWHFAENINAMMEYGYCSVCKLTPVGCVREGCGGCRSEAI